MAKQKRYEAPKIKVKDWSITLDPNDIKVRIPGKPGFVFKDKSKYSRKTKHKNLVEKYIG